jgi:hypothetical protein
MSRVLIIESSARQQDSVSRQLTQDFIANGKPRTRLIRSPCVTWPWPGAAPGRQPAGRLDEA